MIVRPSYYFVRYKTAIARSNSNGSTPSSIIPICTQNGIGVLPFLSSFLPNKMHKASNPIIRRPLSIISVPDLALLRDCLGQTQTRDDGWRNTAVWLVTNLVTIPVSTHGRSGWKYPGVLLIRCNPITTGGRCLHIFNIFQHDLPPFFVETTPETMLGLGMPRSATPSETSLKTLTSLNISHA